MPRGSHWYFYGFSDVCFWQPQVKIQILNTFFVLFSKPFFTISGKVVQPYHVIFSYSIRPWLGGNCMMEVVYIYWSFSFDNHHPPFYGLGKCSTLWDEVLHKKVLYNWRQIEYVLKHWSAIVCDMCIVGAGALNSRALGPSPRLEGLARICQIWAHLPHDIRLGSTDTDLVGIF